MNHIQIELGQQNLERVRQYFRLHPCATQVECAEALKLSTMAVNRHVKQIRAEWRRGQKCKR